MAFQLTSTAFKEGETIPTEYTAQGRDISPVLKWLDPPQGSRTYALICDDPDAPKKTWVHWVIYNLPAESHELAEGVLAADSLPNGTRQGKNDFGNIGYGGPAPPPGKPHRYFFTIYALDTRLDLPAGATKNQLLSAMKGHILAEAKLMGRYGT